MKKTLVLLLMSMAYMAAAQVKLNLAKYHKSNGAMVRVSGNSFQVSWPAGADKKAALTISMDKEKALISSLSLQFSNKKEVIVKDIDPAFIVTIGRRDLVSQNGWNIFFDKVPLKPFHAHTVKVAKVSAAVSSKGLRTVISIDSAAAPGFSGKLEITLYNGSPLINIAAVLSTTVDSTAIIYDAGLISKSNPWKNIAWSDVNENMRQRPALNGDTATNLEVKYRAVIGQTQRGTITVFPAPHQYFYPLDEAFNLKFVWYGERYRKMLDGYGIGIRQDLYGDRRFVPWFNAPPRTEQRLNFFCYIDTKAPQPALSEVKKFTNNDRYTMLPGYKTLVSHFHNEFVMNVMLKNKPVPDTPGFMKVFKRTGVDMVHLGEFHYTAHPKGPDSLRLKEMKALFDMCERFSSDSFLLLPGEEPNEFLGGHWLQFFPKPVYWIMSRKEGQPFVSDDPRYGKVYRIRDAGEMLALLEEVKGLAWTAHPRTKGSTGYPDKYKDQDFFKSARFLGAAWKPIPADLSLPLLGKRVLDLLDDMNNWGEKKKILAEADLFTIEPENEMYAHLNVNYLQLDKLPSYSQGWQPVIDALQQGKFFSTTGEVLIPDFAVNGQSPGGEAIITGGKPAMVSFVLKWTFPMNYAEIVSGDGKNVYRERVDLSGTFPFGERKFRIPVQLKKRKWVRLEAWDIAANGAFTQTIWIR